MRLFAIVLATTASSCSIEGLELAGKSCPCVDDYVCDERRNVCVRTDELVIDSAVADVAVDTDSRPDTAVADTRADSLPSGFDCSVHADKKLYCTNRLGAPVRATPKNAGTIVDYMDKSNYSWFTCWTTGDLHGGGNTTWYYTQGDRYSKWGFMCANDLNTTSAFDANPTALGLPKCP